MNKQQIRIIMLHEFKLGRKATQAAENIEAAWGAGTTCTRTVQRWFDRFRSGDLSLEEEDGRGRPSQVDDDELKALVKANPRTTVRELGAALGVCDQTVSTHLAAIGKVKKLDKWVPHDLKETQKIKRLEVASSLLIRNETEPFLGRIVTCDEKWILYDNRKRSGQWLDEDEPPKHFPKPDFHQKKTMVTVWWSMLGIIHYSFLPRGQTITAASYCDELDDFNRKLSELHPALVNRKRPILLHDNAKPHAALITQQKLRELGYEVLPHPPYSPDLAPTDFHFFKHLDSFLHGQVFNDQKSIETAFETFIDSREPGFYREGIQALLERWQKCVDANGEYFD
jgi:histone-lysine N-methyltransferase SETMAR